jgi:hypothetical protein
VSLTPADLARMDAAAERVAAQMPPLTAEQKAALWGLLAPMRAELTKVTERRTVPTRPRRAA